MKINNEQQNLTELKKEFERKSPKIIGGYKRETWALKALDKTSNDSVEKDENGFITAKGVLEAKDGTFYPAFLLLNMKEGGKINNAFFLSESDDYFNLIPLDLALPYLNKETDLLMPFRYRTLEKIENDQFQINWPNFS